MRACILAAIVAAVFLSWAGPSPAQVARGTQCGVAATALMFGDYSVFSGQANETTGEIRIACTAVQTVRISLSQGSHGTYLDRSMARAGGAEVLRYQVYTDVTRQVPWGNGTSGTQQVTGLASVGRVVFTMYARIPAQQFIPAGYYTDQLLATISF